MTLYANQTTVPIDRSKAEIERILTRYGAIQFIHGWKEGMAVVGFQMKGKFLRFNLPVPAVVDFKKLTATRHNWRTGRNTTHERTRSDSAAAQAWEKDVRSRWRALALIIKAKLEAVESGVTMFEEEFLAHFVLPDGKTFGQHALPAIEQAYRDKKMPPLLGFMGDSK